MCSFRISDSSSIWSTRCHELRISLFFPGADTDKENNIILITLSIHNTQNPIYTRTSWILIQASPNNTFSIPMQDYTQAYYFEKSIHIKMTCKLTTKTRRQGTAVSFCQMRSQPITNKRERYKKIYRQINYL